MAKKDDELWDFGFSLVDEKELKQLEEELARKNASLSNTAETYQQKAESYEQKFETIHSLFSTFLKKLSEEPEKSYIHWPNRQSKINQIIKIINELKE